MVRFLYNLVLALLAPVALPYWLLRSRAKGHDWNSAREALGWIQPSQHKAQRAPIWFHAVSVGEVQASVPLLRALRRHLPDAPIWCSTGTATGGDLARRKLEGLVEGVFRAPVDLPWCVSVVLRRLRPRLLVVAETEIWPNWFFEANRFGVPAMIVNGRISDRSAPRYRQGRILFGPALRTLNSILTQSEDDRRRFLAAGSKESTTVQGGNLKYDLILEGDDSERIPVSIQSFLDRCRPGFVFVAGSTREGEERLLLPALRSLRRIKADLLTVVAPRHPHRFDEAAQVLRRSGLPVLRRSEIGENSPADLPAILVLDSLGELAALYGRADMVFVGGSLNGWGGHNVLEPVAFAKPVVVGPHMQNFRRIAADLLAAGGLVQVSSAEDLPAALAALMASPERREAVGRKGLEAALACRGASERAATEAARLYRRALPSSPPRFLATALLGGPSAAWGLVAKGRRWKHSVGLLPSRELGSAVISVGNVTTGGTGKTPAVAWLVERLHEQGRSATVLTRGYGRSDRRLRGFRAGDAADPAVVGDEPAMMAARFARTAPGASFVVGADRYAGGQLAERQGGPDLFVLDDGFQHLRLKRSLDIVLLDATQPFGNGSTLPLGRLRERESALRYADVVVLTRCAPELDSSWLEDRVRAWNPQVRIFRSSMVPRRWIELGTARTLPVDGLLGRRVAAFCGIGNPDSFFSMADSLGCEIVATRSFRDHCRYSPHEVDALCRQARESRAEVLVTTAKDAIKLEAAADLGLPAFWLEIDLEVESSERLMDCVLGASRARQLPDPSSDGDRLP